MVENWGPIVDADIELGDVTVFVGPRGSGKTILSLLIYMLARDVADVLLRGLADSIIEVLKDELRREEIVGLIPNNYVLNLVRREKDNIIEHAKKSLEETLQHEIISYIARTYGVCDLSKIIRAGSNKASICAKYRCSNWTMSTLSELNVENTTSVSIEVDADIVSEIVEKGKLECIVSEDGSIHCVWRSPIVPAKPLYIPVERLAVILDLYGYLSLMLDAYLRQLTLIRDSGRTLSCISGLTLRPVLLEYIETVLQSLQVVSEVKGDLLGEGKFEFEEGKLWYVDKHGVRVPVVLASKSLVQVLGIILPVTCWLKSQPVQKLESKLLVIEEPEVNSPPILHLKIAEYLAELSKEYNVKIVITTHSEYLLARLAHLYAEGIIRNFKAYQIHAGKATSLEVDKETGEIELPESIQEAIDLLTEEVLELGRRAFKNKGD